MSVVVTLWSPKGGSGVTVSTALLAEQLRQAGSSVVVVSPHSDFGSVFGVEPNAINKGVQLADRLYWRLADQLHDFDMTAEFVVVDASSCAVDIRDQFVSQSDRSIALVTTGVLALRALQQIEVRIDGVVVVPTGSSGLICSADVQLIAQAPIVATLTPSRRVAHAVDTASFLGLQERDMAPVAVLCQAVAA